MSKIKAWINAARLRTLPLAFSGILVASFLAEMAKCFSWTIFTMALLTTLLLQVLSNFANDYGDYTHGTDNENRVGPQRTVQSGAIKPKHMKRAMIITGILAFVSGISLLYISLKQSIDFRFITFLIIGLIAIAASIKYTVGKSNFGYKGFGDLFVFLFFGIVAVCGTYFLYSQSLNYNIFLPAISVGLLSTGVLNLNNMRDIVNDKESGKITLVVRMGSQKAKTYHLAIILFALTSLIAFILTNRSYIAFAFIMIPIGLLIWHLLRVYNSTEPKKLDPELKFLSLTTLITSILFGIGILF